MKSRRGGSMPWVIIGLSIIGILGVIALISLPSSKAELKSQMLQEQLVDLRDGIDAYKIDHGWYPCAGTNWNNVGSAEVLVRQLTEYTNALGQPSPQMTAQFPFGPYVKSWPKEPFSQSAITVVNSTDNRSLAALADSIARTDATGGWYYEVKSGNICANLGLTYPSAFAHY